MTEAELKAIRDRLLTIPKDHTAKEAGYAIAYLKVMVLKLLDEIERQQGYRSEPR